MPNAQRDITPSAPQAPFAISKGNIASPSALSKQQYESTRQGPDIPVVGSQVRTVASQVENTLDNTVVQLSQAVSLNEVPGDESPMSGTNLGEVAELKQRIAQLQIQLDHAQRMATIGELTSTTTHEFNNLLMTILNYAKLGMRHKDEPSRDKSLQRIYDAANKATKITCSVLALARNRSGNMEPISLKQIIEDTLILIEREFRKYRVNLECSLDEVPQVSAIGNELQRVLINLLVNARQATPEGGEVRVSLRHDSETNEVVLTIRDTGSGIPKEVLPKIFDPFFSTKSGPDASGKGGTGVGLAACKEIVDAHSGRVRVESSVGKGTAFIIRLPACR